MLTRAPPDFNQLILLPIYCYSHIYIYIFICHGAGGGILVNYEPYYDLSLSLPLDLPLSLESQSLFFRRKSFWNLLAQDSRLPTVPGAAKKTLETGPALWRQGLLATLPSYHVGKGDPLQWRGSDPLTLTLVSKKLILGILSYDCL